MQNIPTGAAGEAVSAPTLSDRVNTIFAAYVAVEAEQFRLGDLGTPEADAEADALGSKALALAEELDAIDDFSGSADLAAARALHELMLLHPWNKLGQIEWNYDDRDHLATVAALAGITTGAVRVEAARVMATNGVVIPDEASDPMLDLVRRNAAYMAAYAAHPDDAYIETPEFFDANDGAAGVLLNSDPPKPTTTAGAVAAIRYVMEDRGFVQKPHAAILRQALAFLEGKA